MHALNNRLLKLLNTRDKDVFQRHIDAVLSVPAQHNTSPCRIGRAEELPHVPGTGSLRAVFHLGDKTLPRWQSFAAQEHTCDHLLLAPEVAGGVCLQGIPNAQ